LEPVSHFFYSDRLKLQFWDWGTNGKPALLLVHGGLDHARSWDATARALREDYHVYALDLRGHGNSAWAPGALYSIAEHVLDLSALIDIINGFPITIIGHSLGGIVSLIYSGIYPDRVRKLEHRTPHSYKTLAEAVARMKEANPFLSDPVAEHLTVHGTNWNADGSIIWKFDNYARIFAPYGLNIDDAKEVLSQITSPTLLFWGRKSWAQDPEIDGRASVIRDHRLVKLDNAGHWVHHDQFDLFLAETRKFLAE